MQIKPQQVSRADRSPLGCSGSLRRYAERRLLVGNVTSKAEENKTKGKKFKVYCSTCANETNHIVIQSFDTSGSEVVGDEATIDWSDNYQIIQCQGCDTVSFRHLNWFSENQDYWGGDDYSDGTTSWLFPKRTKGTLKTKDYYNAPNNLRRIYRETVDCFNNDSLILSAAGLRAIIEGICADQSITDGPIELTKPDGTTHIIRKNNLEGKISGLCEKGILTKSNSAILHEHRYLGNDAVHDLAQPSAQELTLAIEIIEHTLESLYEIPEKAEELRTKRLKRKAKA